MKRSSNEQLPDNQKRYNSNGVSYPAPSPPLQPSMYMNQYYGGGNSMQYPDYMSMMNQNYSMYNQSNQVVWSQSPGPSSSSVMFNCSQPPPPLPKEPTPKPPPPPPDTSSNSTQSYNSRYGASSHFNSPRQPGPRNNNNPPMQQMRQTRGAGRGGGGGGNYPRPDRGGHKRQPYTQRGFNPGQNSSPNGPRLPKPQKHPNDSKSDNPEENKILVNKKAKRKPMSTRYTRKREWDRGDAVKAIALEKEYNRLQRTAMLILKFPDPEISKDLVKKYSPFINSVHFQQPATPRYCFVQLKDGADIEKVRQQISQIPFGSGFVSADKKKLTYEDHSMITPEEIDPYTLYIGNLPTTVSVAIIKKNFPKALRIDIGYAQRLKYTRYAFIRYNTVEDAMEAYKQTFNLLIESRSLIVRFRRQRGNVGLPGELKTQNPTKTGLTPDEDNKLKETILKKKDSENTIDSKAHVLEEAANLMHKMAKSNNSNALGPSVSVKSEKSTDAISEDTNDIEDDEVDEYDHLLLGTKVKDEPPDEDDYNDDVVHHYFDDAEEDELDLLPEEEDDIVDEDYGLHDGEDEDEVDDDDVATFGYHHWEEVRRRELDMKEEKPDISLLPSIGNKKKNESSDLSKENKDDDLDDLFNRMNPEDEDSV